MYSNIKNTHNLTKTQVNSILKTWISVSNRTRWSLIEPGHCDDTNKYATSQLNHYFFPQDSEYLKYCKFKNKEDFAISITNAQAIYRMIWIPIYILLLFLIWGLDGNYGSVNRPLENLKKNKKSWLLKPFLTDHKLKEIDFGCRISGLLMHFLEHYWASLEPYLHNSCSRNQQNMKKSD